MDKGYDVFSNTEPTGPADVIVRNRENGKMVAVDVKRCSAPYYRADGSRGLKGAKPLLREDGVFQIVLDEERKEWLIPETFWDTLQ